MLAAFSPRQRLGLGLVAFATALGGTLYYAGVDGLIVFPFMTVALAGLAWLVALGTDALGNHVAQG